MSLYWQQTKERVKLLIQLADGFCDKGHAHALEIKKWVSSVDKRYRDFSLRMDKYRTCLETALGISSDSNKAVSAHHWRKSRKNTDISSILPNVFDKYCSYALYAKSWGWSCIMKDHRKIQPLIEFTMCLTQVIEKKDITLIFVLSKEGSK